MVCSPVELPNTETMDDRARLRGTPRGWLSVAPRKIGVVEHDARSIDNQRSPMMSQR
jgi:hypothetical protein